MKAIAVGFLSMVPAMANTVPPHAATSRGSADQAAIRSIAQACVNGWNKGSGAGFAAPFAEDADYVVVNGMRLKGRRQIALAHQRIFDTFYRGTKLWMKVDTVRFLKPNVALMHSVSRVLKPGESGASPKANAIQVFVVTKKGGTWRIDAFHNTPIEDRAGPQAKR
jgi:uncharacterized protein (TIGR02246 family)